MHFSSELAASSTRAGNDDDQRLTRHVPFQSRNSVEAVSLAVQLRTVTSTSTSLMKLPRDFIH
jgi:hypothetical protein